MLELTSCVFALHQTNSLVSLVVLLSPRIIFVIVYCLFTDRCYCYSQTMIAAIPW